MLFWLPRFHSRMVLSDEQDRKEPGPAPLPAPPPPSGYTCGTDRGGCLIWEEVAMNGRNRCGSNLHAPHTGRVVQGGVELSNPAEVRDVPDVPHVNAVVAVDAGQPAVGGVIGHRHGVGVTAPWLAGEQLTEEEDKGHLKNSQAPNE